MYTIISIIFNYLLLFLKGLLFTNIYAKLWFTIILYAFCYFFVFLLFTIISLYNYYLRLFMAYEKIINAIISYYFSYLFSSTK